MNSRWTAGFTFIFVLSCCAFSIEPAGARAAQNPPANGGARQLQGDLLRAYFVRARIHDLLGLLQAPKSDMTGAERVSFQQRIAATDRAVQTLETWRYQFYYRPQDAGLGEKTLKALDSVIAELGTVTNTATREQDKDTNLQLEQAAAELSTLRNQITRYLQATFPGRFVTAAAAGSAPASPPKSEPALASASTNLISNPNVQTSKPSAPNAGKAPSVSVSVRPVSLRPQQVEEALRNVYFASARMKDLLSLLEPQEWKMTGGERAAFQQQLQSLQSGLANLEKWRYQFASHVRDTGSGAKTVEAISSLLPHIQQVEAILGQFAGQRTVSDFEQPAKELGRLNNTMASYLASLRSTYQKQLAYVPPGSPALETERISAAAPPAPAQYLPALSPPLSAEQVKALLYQLYTSLYRIRDLLNQERPDAWKAPQPERAAAAQARSSLLAEAGEIEKWRALFGEDPENMYEAFQLYRSVQELVQPLQAFSQSIDRYENQSLASDYVSAAGNLQARLSDLIPYITFFLERESRSIGLYQSDLAACQNTLTYAMHGFVRSATPMTNIVPDFKGRRAAHKRTSSSPRRRSHHTRSPNSS